MQTTYTLLVEGNSAWEIGHRINEISDALHSNYAVRGGIIHLTDVISVSALFEVVRSNGKCLGVYAIFKGTFVPKKDVPPGLTTAIDANEG